MITLTTTSGNRSSIDAITRDSSGNIYIAGKIGGSGSGYSSISFPTTSGSIELEKPAGPITEIFVAKLNSSNNKFEWATKTNGSGMGLSVINDLKATNDGIYIVGAIACGVSGGYQSFPGASGANLIYINQYLTNQSIKGFGAKLSTNGNWQIANEINGSGNSSLEGVYPVSSDEMVTFGWINGHITLSGSPAGYYFSNSSNTNSDDFLIAKTSGMQKGSWAWATSSNNSIENEKILSADSINDNIYFTVTRSPYQSNPVASGFSLYSGSYISSGSGQYINIKFNPLTATGWENVTVASGSNQFLISSLSGVPTQTLATNSGAYIYGAQYSGTGNPIFFGQLQNTNIKFIAKTSGSNWNYLYQTSENYSVTSMLTDSSNNIFIIGKASGSDATISGVQIPRESGAILKLDTGTTSGLNSIKLIDSRVNLGYGKRKAIEYLNNLYIVGHNGNDIVILKTAK